MSPDREALPAPADRAHRLLQELMALLDQALPGESHRELRATLRERGTSACAFARLGTEDEMQHDLEAMQEAASAVASGSEEGTRITDLRRLIDASLAELRGH